MTADKDIEARRREAAHWFARLNQKRVSATDVTGFSQWRRSPENAAAYARVEALWDAADTLAGDPDVERLRQVARGRANRSRRPAWKTGKALVPAGAALALALAVAAAPIWAGRSRAYDTEVGERRVVALNDGSEITLDTNSAIRVRFTRDGRRVELIRGQAFFEVQGDTARPFVVLAGRTDVTALGTQFDVRRLGSGARVTLVEGRVEVTTRSADGPRWTLSPGEQVSTMTARSAVQKVNVEAETSWTAGRLIFDGDTVEAAVAEINRYNRVPIVLEAPGIARIAVSGAFDSRDAAGFVSALTALYPVTATTAPDGRIVIRDDPTKKSTAP